MMIDDFPIKADALEIKPGPRADLIRAVFRSDAGETKTVDFVRETLPKLVGVLLREAGHSTTKIEPPPSLSTGLDYRQLGYSLRHLDDDGDEGLEITLHLELLKEGRKANFQFLMSPEAVAQLRRELNSRG